MRMQVWARRLRLGVTATLAVTCLIAIALLAAEVRGKLAALQRAASDNTQWVMMQTEVEVLRLQAAVAAAQETPAPPQLDEVRRWFNVFYSRLSMLEQSPVYAPLLAQPDYRADHDRLRAFLDQFVLLIDAPDAQLATGLSRIAAPLPDMRASARQLTLNALSDFTAQSDLMRESISFTLVRLAAVSAALLVIVAGVAAILALQFRRSEAQKRALSEAGTRLSTIVATSADGIVVTDPDGTIREFNRAAEAIFGLPAAAAFGRNAFALLFAEATEGPQQHALLQALRNPAADSDHPIRVEVDARRADGQTFPAEVSVARAQIAETGLVVAFVRDISNRREADAALTRALDRAQAGEKAKAEFLAVMSHEMRTPLNGLIGSMELLRRITTGPEQRDLLSVMATSGEILLDHVNSVLDVSRAEAGMIRPEKTAFNLDRLLEDTIANQAGLAAASGNSLALARPSGPLGMVTGDAMRLRQILLNLIGNAVKFTQGGSIEIEAERPASPPDMVEIRVTDTGIGIAEADLDRIFEDFVTLDTSYGRSTGGTGLGLGIARRLARAMGGDISVESLKGEGSLFWLRLPLPPADVAATELASSPAQPTTQTVDDPPQTLPLSVLLVEDNTINRFLLRRFVESGGHAVTEAVDGIEAVNCAARAAFDVILMDISMPRMDGIAATQAIRAGQGPSHKARILALTAHALPEELARFREAGMETALTKPIARLTLLQAIANDPARLPAPPLHAPPLLAQPEATPESAHSQAVLDRDNLADLIRQIGPNSARPLIQRLIAEGDDIIPDLAAGTASSGAASLATLCHRLSGSSGPFGTTGLRRALLAAETALKRQIASQDSPPKGDPDATAPDIATRLAELSPVWQATRAALLQELANLPEDADITTTDQKRRPAIAP